MIRPSVGVSKPANMRSKVDLPEPEPPSRAKISPLLIFSETSSTAKVSSKYLVTRSILTSTSLGFCKLANAFLYAPEGIAIGFSQCRKPSLAAELFNLKNSYFPDLKRVQLRVFIRCTLLGNGCETNKLSNTACAGYTAGLLRTSSSINWSAYRLGLA